MLLRLWITFFPVITTVCTLNKYYIDWEKELPDILLSNNILSCLLCVNFMCQLDRIIERPDIRLNNISGYVHEGVFGRDYHLNQSAV